ncbi:hypothetical protein LTR91_022863 [Friedmanniomyces endolithicus]|uniref:Uncharacterized protein n=1 Tax=Friedmanniomyces endolithicus TaxID=329885 RepID=A0AAN6H7R4_9PEZI|nr:hypothetical protein LTR94_018997 [Friedmanniomyces endolithicus]KAK0778642.1 hypothetical protein LTR75_015584 [Friedmanniomyces endolithicus]KAK0780545.1 hypothetical protein LTR59_012794 [Friedmanniomyces endolithicus]KAK0782123.1 hypothetical protein LTR38_013499 [Friedmanniomyces endolithicus]KAK0865136.1 hypothetical protein LTR87_015542 [Friedmanniomyces endolithicus]
MPNNLRNLTPSLPSPPSSGPLSQEIYVNEELDVKVLKDFERIIKEEWNELRNREQLADSDGNSD